MTAHAIVRPRFTTFGKAAPLLGSTIALALLQQSESANTAAVQLNILNEPPVFTSSAGVLDILMVARETSQPIFDQLRYNKPAGWVYEICPRPSRTATSCPPGRSTSSAYGGTRLALKPGDKLKIRLVNRLPNFKDNTEAKHVDDNALLLYNPTNLHTHGLIVEPRYPSVARPTWGDNIFVIGYNDQQPPPSLPPNDPLSAQPHKHAQQTLAPIEYEIDIPSNHPSGLYWFHPHVHGIALNQVAAGLAGIITVGDPKDYTCEDSNCVTRWSPAKTRHLVLKETQINADGTLLSQQDPEFCEPNLATYETNRKGSCAGQVVAGGADHTGGRWFFTINGQVYPTIPVGSQDGEIWRITAASASNSYDLHLHNDAENRDMLFQVVAVDGVSITSVAGAQAAQLQAASNTKFRVVDCGSAATLKSDPSAAAAVCTDSIRMMPSSRVEVRVAYRDTQGRVAVPPRNAKAVFRTIGFDTAGDLWPAVDLAEVQFSTPSFAPGKPAFAAVRGQAGTLNATGGIFAAKAATAGPQALNQNCKTPLPSGHHRRIYYGNPNPGFDGFGLAYEEVDTATGMAVPGTFTDVSVFDPTATIVCLPLGAGNTPTTETWELVNVHDEDHNFHIHQTKFRVVEPASSLQTQVASAATKGAPLPNPLPFPKGTVLHDNIPLPANRDSACDGSVDAWRRGDCAAKPVVVEIAFSQLGDFVYHCHILEHEDGGMMARISVVSPN